MTEILIIDDDLDAVSLGRRILECAGYAVSHASSVTEAKERLVGRIPHLILLDLKMPGLSGFDFLKMRAEMPSFSNVPVIVVSGDQSGDSVFGAIQLGACDYLLKPYTAARMLQRVRKRFLENRPLSYDLKPGDDARVRMSVGALIVRVLETAIVMSSPVKMAPQSRLELKSRAIERLGAAGAVFQVAGDAREENGHYECRINVSGLRRVLGSAEDDLS